MNNRSKELVSEKYFGKKVEIIGRKTDKAQYIDVYSFKEIPEQKVQQASEVKVAYVCPDHLNVESANQGVCPKCGKILEKRISMTANKSYYSVASAYEKGYNWWELYPGKKVSSSSSSITLTKYTCPMHPEVTADKPGKCPKCGMKLIKNSSK